MEREQLIILCKELFFNHKQATSLKEEYTEEIYDFLVNEKKIILTVEEKIAIFEMAKRDYGTELQSRINIKIDPELTKKALYNLRMLKLNQLSKPQNDYVKLLAKYICIVKYFDSIDELEF